MVLLYEDFVKNKNGKEFEITVEMVKHRHGFQQMTFFAKTIAKKSKNPFTHGRLWLFVFPYEHKGKLFFPIGLGLVTGKNLRTGLYTQLIIYALDHLNKYSIDGIFSPDSTGAVSRHYSYKDNLRTKEADLFWENLYKNQSKHPGILVKRDKPSGSKKYYYYLTKK